MMNDVPLRHSHLSENDSLPLRIDFEEIFATLSDEQKSDMRDALMVMNECERALANTSHNIVSEILRFTDKFEYWKHVPPKDVLDGQSSAQYYYHAHPQSDDKSATTLHDGEHGHFHCFMRLPGILGNEHPYPVPDLEKSIADPKTHLSHICAIAMDKHGNITRLITTNRWVTGEVWYEAEHAAAMASRFEIDHAQPSWPVNMWVSHCFRAFLPFIEVLLHKRDEIITQWQEGHQNTPNYNIFDDRNLEVTSYCDIRMMDIAKRFS